jgi:NADPH:quinone reductase-like Zn-dependent oxidoreductase
MTASPVPAPTLPSDTMRAVALPRAGALGELVVRHLARVAPGRGQVEVRVAAAALNPADLKVARGDFIGRILHARVAPLIVGYDYAGTVERCGPDVTELRVGDAVFGFLPYARRTRAGTFAEYVVVDAATAARAPEHVPPAVAAAAATPGVTAIQALRDHGRLRPGGRALIIGAAGGVGTLAIGVAKRLGAHATAVCAAAASELVRALGADEVVERGTDLRALDTRFDVILDTAAAHGFPSLRRLLAPRGAYVTTLPSAGWFAGAALALASSRRSRFIAVAPVAADLTLLGSWLADGLRVPIDRQFAVRDAAAAFDRLGRGAMRGRIAIEVGGGW